MPAMEVEQASPDGRYVARVRNHLSIAPPRQSLWIGEPDSSGVKRVMRLAVCDADTRETRAYAWLVEQDGYPTSYEVRDLRLVATYRACEGGEEECSQTRQLSIPTRDTTAAADAS